MSRRGEKYLLGVWPPPPPATGTARAAGFEACRPRWGDGRADSSLPSKSGQASDPKGRLGASCTQLCSGPPRLGDLFSLGK